MNQPNGVPPDDMMSVVEVQSSPTNPKRLRIKSLVGLDETLLFLNRATEKVRRDLVFAEMELRKEEESKIVPAGGPLPPFPGRG